MSVSQDTIHYRVTSGSDAYKVLRSYIGQNGTSRKTQDDVEKRIGEFQVFQRTEKEGGFFGFGAREVKHYEFLDQQGNKIVVSDDGQHRRETALYNRNNQLLREQNFTNAGVREGELRNGQMQYAVYDQRLRVQNGRRVTDNSGRTMADQRRDADGWTLVKNIGRGIGDAVRDPWTYIKAGAGAAAFAALGATALAPALPFIAGGALVVWGAHKLWQGYQATRKGGAAALTTDFARSTANETTQIALAVGLSRLLSGGGTARTNGGGNGGNGGSNAPSNPNPSNAQSIPQMGAPTNPATPAPTNPATPAPTNPATPAPTNPATPAPQRVPVTARRPQMNNETMPNGFEPTGFKTLSEVTQAFAKPAQANTSTRVSLSNPRPATASRRSTPSNA